MTTSVSYAHAPFPVRGDFDAAHQRYWRRLQSPGAWWTSAQRITIAAETREARHCALCRARRDSLSPNAPAGRHDSAAVLPDAAIDAIHRLVNDSGRLSAGWFSGIMDTGLGVGHYVELVGTVAAMLSIDSFCRGIGVELHALPAPGPGQPSQYQPPVTRVDEAWVPMIPADANDGAEADLWQPGRTGNVIRALSLVPDEVRTLGELSEAHYLPHASVMNPAARGAHLNRSQIELIAGRVSALNQCFY
jgi:hypothetical protein